jgi:hypothetical protein
MGEPGPWEYKEALDAWLPGFARWGVRDTDSFPEGFEKPRSCNFCGSVHPEDAIALLKQGWEVEASKPYKRYLHPPGYTEYMRTFLDWERRHMYHEAEMGEDPGERPTFVHVTPPAKLYTMHLDKDQIARFNAALDAQKEQGCDTE